jgi:integrase
MLRQYFGERQKKIEEAKLRLLPGHGLLPHFSAHNLRHTFCTRF